LFFASDGTTGKYWKSQTVTSPLSSDTFCSDWRRQIRKFHLNLQIIWLVSTWT